MNWQVIPLPAVVPIPWRNGGGITREMLAFPDAENWIWRISVAEVASDGAFSYFPGVQRWLAILSGAGVRLSMDAEVIELTERSAPLAFSGATAVHCNLLHGPVQDLNLMLRAGPNLKQANVGQMRRIFGKQRFVIDAAKTVAIYSANAPAVLQLNGVRFVLSESALAWQSLPACAELVIAATSAILMVIALEIENVPSAPDVATELLQRFVCR